jgi:HEAT repeat protein
VAIRASASHEVRRLIGDLESGDSVRRDAAVARLAVIGTRAVRQLLEHLTSAAAPDAQAALLLALEAIPDPRSVDPVLHALDAPEPAVRQAATRAARGLLALPQGTRILDRLAARALDTAVPGDERVAGIEALAGLPARTLRPLLERLREDPDRTVRDAVARAGVPVDDPVAELEEAADGWLPREPETVLHLVARAAGDAPLSTLHRLIEKIRSREGEGRAGKRRDWGAVRAALHLALARRGSKVALYDLRETLERAKEPLPADYLSALALIGDATALEPLAVAFVAARGMADADQWRRDVALVFRAIVAREGLTRRHGPIRRVRARYREEIAELLA